MTATNGQQENSAWHPLEPASPAELGAAVTAVLRSGRLGDRAEICWAALEEPAKHDVLAWTPDQPGLPRRVRVVAVDRNSATTYEAVVDVATGAFERFDALPGAHAPLLGGEIADAQSIKYQSAVAAALAVRGVTDLERVIIEPWPAGYFGRPFEDGRRRLGRALFYVTDSEVDLHWSRPVQGLVAVYDRATNEVLELIDEGAVPVPAASHRIDVGGVGSLRDDLKPLEIVQRDGASFTMEGSELRWQRWRMRLSMHPIEGLVLHQIGYDDPEAGRTRSIVYRASLAEMVVPYGDPQGQHYWRHVFDAGEIGMGRTANSLKLGCDCLGEILYLDTPRVGFDGSVGLLEHAVCIHEEDNNVLWRHGDVARNVTEARRDRRLVVSFWSTIGNYDYGFFWYFHQDGTIEAEVKLTGIVLASATPVGAAAGPHAVKLTDELEAPHHQHFFCVRLDLDVDGPTNRVEEVEVSTVPMGPQNPWGNAFVPATTVLTHEASAKRRTNALASRSWRIVNPEVVNALGKPVAYQLHVPETPLIYGDPSSPAVRRARFAENHVHVTRYAADEMRAAGDYPSQHPGEAGLPAYMAADRDLTDTDVVVWVTCGVTHIARPEEYPVMPVERTGFMLRPSGFFTRNPALDVAPLAMVNRGADHCC